MCEGGRIRRTVANLLRRLEYGGVRDSSLGFTELLVARHRQCWKWLSFDNCCSVLGCNDKWIRSRKNSPSEKCHRYTETCLLSSSCLQLKLKKMGSASRDTDVGNFTSAGKQKEEHIHWSIKRLRPEIYGNILSKLRTLLELDKVSEPIYIMTF